MRKIISNDFITLPLITVITLFKINSNVVTLFIFYAQCAEIQKNGSVRATDTFCMKGLGWGSAKFYSTKKILIDTGLIKQKGGKGYKAFIEVKFYIKNKQYLNSDSGSKESETNKTNTKSLNKINTESVEVLCTSTKSKYSIYRDLWNSSGKLEKHGPLQESTISLIDRVLEILKPKQLIDAISNYTEIISNPDIYYFNTEWDFHQFLYLGLNKIKTNSKTGVFSFISESKPFARFKRTNSVEKKDKYDKLRLEFKPVVTKWDKIFDKEKKVYYGISIDKISTYRDRMDDVYFELKHNKRVDFSMIASIEQIITAILWNRKAQDDFENFVKMMKLWKDNVNKHKDKALKLIEMYY